MTGEWLERRDTFRHGDLPAAILQAARKRLRRDAATAMTLRQLAGDIGVNHRALYRHFPDKEALLSAVAIAGWRELQRDLSTATAELAAGEEFLVACAVAFFTFAKREPELFHLMSGPRLNASGRFPELDRAVIEALSIIKTGFEGLSLSATNATARAALFAAALQGISAQMLHGRLKFSSKSTTKHLAEIGRRFVQGLR